MKRITFLIVLLAAVAFVSPAADSRRYILMDASEESAIRKAIESDGFWCEYHGILMEGADSVLATEPRQRIMIGRRLLETSREVLRRTLLTGYAYRLTHDPKYAARCERELTNAAAFTDWNPNHFLDVAEMTAAMGIGYSWCGDAFSPESRELIENAILEKGIAPACDSRHNGWLRQKNNWNQVCNGGITIGALALREKYPEMADSLSQRAVKSVKRPMKQYAPDGAYPEGYSYWGYGTIYNVLLIDVLEKAYGTDFGLSSMPGFLNSAEFMQNMILGDGNSMNYGDCNNAGRLNPPMFWLASKAQHPEWLSADIYQFSKAPRKYTMNYRYSVFGMIWGCSVPTTDRLSEPTTGLWSSKDTDVPVAIMRTTLEYNKGISMALKGGAANGGHAHMDGGEFLLTKGNLRWAIDLGPQDYTSLELAGLDLWNKTQSSDRWKCFRYNNLAHNTLTINDQLHNVGGKAEVLCTESMPDNMYAVMDMTALFSPVAKKVTRRGAIIDSKRAEITDTVVGGDEPMKLRWTMVTPAKPEISADGKSIVLKQKGETMTLRFDADADISPELKIWSAQSENAYDAPNPGVWRVGYEAILPGGNTSVIKAILE